MQYEDTTVAIDSAGITIKRYGTFGAQRTIRFEDITTVTASTLGSVGRWRLVGAGPGGGGRNWYGWDSARRSKATVYTFDVDRFWRPSITPDDPALFLAALPSSLDIR
jgi:hypothetical protein